MAYWDDEPELINAVHKKVVWKTEIIGDFDTDFIVVFHLARITYQGGVEVGWKDLGLISCNRSVAEGDPLLEPSITKIRNGCRTLARALRTS